MTGCDQDDAMLYEEHAKTFDEEKSILSRGSKRTNRSDKDDWYVHDKELTSDSVLNMFLNE